MTCPPGEVVASVPVPGNGTVATSHVLLAGQSYRLRAFGFALTNATHGQDSEYDFVIADPANLLKVTGGVPGFDFGIAVDGATKSWGPYNTGHVYETRIVGAGRAVTFQLLDNYYADNSGTITIEVSCA